MYLKAEPDRYRTEVTITAGTGGDVHVQPARRLVLHHRGRLRQRQRRARELRRLQEEERNDYIGQTGTAEAFRDIGATITLYPTPTTGQLYTHIYLPTAPVISTVADTIDCRIGHEDWIEKVVARAFLQMKREYDGRWDEDIAKLEAELKEESNMRYFDDLVTMARHRTRRAWPYGPGIDGVLLSRLPRP
jgi:hypothetical protein